MEKGVAADVLPPIRWMVMLVDKGGGAVRPVLGGTGCAQPSKPVH